jgi:hypothetical protein
MPIIKPNGKQLRLKWGEEISEYKGEEVSMQIPDVTRPANEFLQRYNRRFKNLASYPYSWRSSILACERRAKRRVSKG